MKHYWETKDGEEIEISKIETNHLINIIKMLERAAENGVEVVVSMEYEGDNNYMTGDTEILEGKEFLNTTPYKWLKKELNKRLAQN